MNIDPNEPIHGTYDVGGLTIRAEISSRIMAGLCAGQMVYEIAMKKPSDGDAIVAEASVKLADALIAELNKPVAPSERED